MNICKSVYLSLILISMVATTAIADEKNDKSKESKLKSTGAIALNLMFDSGDLNNVPSKLRSRALIARTSFVDLVKDSKKRLQIAIVIDGTDSMGIDIKGVLDSLNSMAGDLARWKSTQGEAYVSFAVVVYRDSGSPDGPINFPQKTFTSDLTQLKKVIKGIKTQTGLPAFQEQMDVGIHDAITKLNWKKDENTSRWIMVFGDAPPYKPGVKIGNTGRFHTDLELVELAAKNDIVLNFVLCSSGFAGEEDKELNKAFQRLLPVTKKFMTGLAEETGGAVLDLSDPKVREMLMKQAASKLELEYQTITNISPQDLSDAKSKIDLANDPNQQVRFAVLPFSKLDQPALDPDSNELRIAREVTEKLRQLPQVDVASFSEVKSALGKRSFDATKPMESAARLLKVDYLVWGNEIVINNNRELNSKIYSGSTGKQIAMAQTVAKGDDDANKQVGELFVQLVNNFVSQISDSDKVSHAIVKRGISADAKTLKSVTQPISKNARARRELLTGLNLLESALELGKDDPGFDQNAIKNAVRRLTAANRFEGSKNPITLSLLASAHYNAGRLGVADDSMNKMYKSLQNAYSNRDKALSKSMKVEIEADYALLIEKDIKKAIKLYESLADSYTDNPINTVRRANWMLAGIYCGDWKVEDEFTSVKKARARIIRIMAFWPKSPEAEFYRKALHWNDRVGTQHPHVPKSNELTLSESMVLE